VGGSDIPFPLVVQCLGEKYWYTPRSDFHICIRNFPHLLLETNSSKGEYDQRRLLVQAACMARIGNWLRNPNKHYGHDEANGNNVDYEDERNVKDPTANKQEPIVIMAVYIKENFNAIQHLVCQPDPNTPKVEYIEKAFDLTDSDSAFRFLFQLYNFLSIAKASNDCLSDPSSRLDEAKISLDNKGLLEISSAMEPMSTKGKGVQDRIDNPSVQREITSAHQQDDMLLDALD